MKAGVDIQRHDTINIQNTEQGKKCRPGDQDKQVMLVQSTVKDSA